MLKAMVPVLGAAAVVAVVIGWGLALSPAGAQAPGGTPSPTPVLANPPTPAPAPANVRAVNGMNAGEASVLWDAVDGAAFYRIGWVAYDDIDAARAEGRNWLDAFDFKDVENRGQTTQLLKGLAPGAAYAFIVASVERRFGSVHNWSDWVYLTMAAADATSCPTDTGTEPSAPGGATPTPTPTPTPKPILTPTPRPTPTGTGDYDTDKDGLIEVSNLAQLAAIRADLDGDGISPAPAYAAAFPDAMPGMGCPDDDGCIGYELVANLDFDSNGNGEADAGDAYWNDGAGWIPIGDGRHKFTADFDGNNHTIANLYINRSRADMVGLFGSVSSSSIKQVGLVSAAVIGDDYVGGLVGYSTLDIISASHYNSNISGSYATGSVSGNYYVGGLVGYSGANTISGSYATGSVSGNDYVGGLVGSSNYDTIGGSYVAGTVSGDYYVGGLAGSIRNSTISASYAAGSVSGSGDDIGGLVGRSENGEVIVSYAVGRVSATGDTFYIGGLVGYDKDSQIAVSYWDTETTGQAGSYGGVGKTTAELQSPTSYAGIYAEWNWDLDRDVKVDDPWHFGNSRQYPALQYGGLDVAAQRR